jgi:hypothetical protein
MSLKQGYKLSPLMPTVLRKSQSSAKKRYSGKYGLMPINNAKSTLTTAFMGKFRERRSQGTYQNALPTLLPVSMEVRPEREFTEEKSQVASWLESYGTPLRVPPRLSAPLSKAKVDAVSSDSGPPDLAVAPQEQPAEAVAPALTQADVVTTS